MDQDHAQEAFALACEVFVAASVLPTAIGVPIDKYRNYMEVSFNVMLSQGLSLYATDNNSQALVGCLVACDYVSQSSDETVVPECLKPVKALFKQAN